MLTIKALLYVLHALVMMQPQTEVAESFDYYLPTGFYEDFVPSDIPSGCLNEPADDMKTGAIKTFNIHPDCEDYSLLSRSDAEARPEDEIYNTLTNWANWLMAVLR